MKKYFTIEIRKKGCRYVSAFIIKDGSLICLSKKELYNFLSCQIPLFSLYASSPRHYTFDDLVSFLVSSSIQYPFVRYRLIIVYLAK